LECFQWNHDSIFSGFLDSSIAYFIFFICLFGKARRIHYIIKRLCVFINCIDGMFFNMLTCFCQNFNFVPHFLITFFTKCKIGNHGRKRSRHGRTESCHTSTTGCRRICGKLIRKFADCHIYQVIFFCDCIFDHLIINLERRQIIQSHRLNSRFNDHFFRDTGTFTQTVQVVFSCHQDSFFGK